jgi:hypothetical protein
MVTRTGEFRVRKSRLKPPHPCFARVNLELNSIFRPTRRNESG